jgi:hypothetical protein
MASIASTFKPFPHFTKLSLADKKVYEELISSYPPIAEISFASLMTWWNYLDSCAVSRINNNLLISYWLPGDERNSGTSLVGDKNIDESICQVFDYQRSQNMSPRLVHVPEFVVGSVQYPQSFRFIPEHDYDECIFAVAGFYPLAHATQYVRSKIEKFLHRVDEKSITARSLDLRISSNRELLLKAAKQWFTKGSFNDVAAIDVEATEFAIKHADLLDIENVCLYIEEELAGFQLYQLPPDKRYAIATFVKVDCQLQGAPEYMCYLTAKWFAERGITYINYEQDLGIQRLRAEKLAFGPANYLRKYTIEPIV